LISTLIGSGARPQTYAVYQDADLALQAAVLAEGIAEHQPFIEGNKRMADATYRQFLLLNGYEIDASDEERAEWITRLSEAVPSEELVEELAARIRSAAVMVTES
jgi:death-on-curing protein